MFDWITAFNNQHSHPMVAFIGVTSAHGPSPQATACSGQSYKAPTIVNYDSRVAPDLKIPHITTLES